MLGRYRDKYWFRKLEALERTRDVAGLAKLLRHDESWMVSRAAGALVKIGGQDAVEALLAALDETNADARVQIVYKLGETKSAAAVAPLVKLLRVGRLADSGVADAAAKALGKIGDSVAITAMVDALVDGTFAGDLGTLRSALQTGVRVLRGGEDDHERYESIAAQVNAQLAEASQPRAKSPVGRCPPLIAG